MREARETRSEGEAARRTRVDNKEVLEGKEDSEEEEEADEDDDDDEEEEKAEEETAAGTKEDKKELLLDGREDEREEEEEDNEEEEGEAETVGAMGVAVTDAGATGTVEVGTRKSRMAWERSGASAVASKRER